MGLWESPALPSAYVERQKGEMTGLNDLPLIFTLAAVLLCLHTTQSLTTPQSPCSPAAAWTTLSVGLRQILLSKVKFSTSRSTVAQPTSVMEPLQSSCLWLWPCVFPSCPPSGAWWRCSFLGYMVCTYLHSSIYDFHSVDIDYVMD